MRNRRPPRAAPSSARDDGTTATARAASPSQALSGGQRRRLGVALGVIGRPELLFLDEPTTGFDPQARRQFWDLVRDLAAGDTTVLLTTHYLDEAETLAGRVGVTTRGRLVEVATPAMLGGRNSASARVRWPAPEGPQEAVTDTPARLWQVIASSLRQSITPDRLLGRVLSSYRLVGRGAAFLGAALAATYGLRVPAAVTACAMPLVLLLSSRALSPAAIRGPGQRRTPRRRTRQRPTRQRPTRRRSTRRLALRRLGRRRDDIDGAAYVRSMNVNVHSLDWRGDRCFSVSSPTGGSREGHRYGEHADDGGARSDGHPELRCAHADARSCNAGRARRLPGHQVPDDLHRQRSEHVTTA